MMTGDSYLLPIKIETENGAAKPSMFKEIEVFFGDVRKTFLRGEITFDEKTETFMVPLSQKETFRQKETVAVQIRVKTLAGDVIGINAGTVDIAKAKSKVVL
jgi:hypothetical protein